MYVLVTTETLSQYNNLEIEIFFTLLEDTTYTINLEKAATFNTSKEGERMKKLLSLDNFTITEIPNFDLREK